LELKPTATTKDKQRISAERLLVEAVKSNQQGAAGFQQTVEKGKQALTLWRELADQFWEASTLSLIGNAYFSANKYEEAIDYHNQALQISRQVKDSAGEASALTNLGNAHRRLGHYDKALGYFEQALQIRRELKDRNGEGVALTRLGVVYMYLDQSEKSRDCLEQALQITREIKDRKGEAQTLQVLGNVASDDKEEAGDHYEQALQIFRELKDRPGEATTLGNLGNLYRHSQPEKSREYTEQALQISRELKDKYTEGLILNNLGNFYRDASQFEKARDYYEQSLQITREIKDRHGESFALLNLGTVYGSLRQYEKMRDFYEQTLQIRREVKNRAGESATLYQFAKAEFSGGNLDQARKLVEESLKIEESLRFNIYNPDLRATYLASEQESNAFYIDVLMRLHTANPSAGFDARAVEASERGRARGLLELLTEAGAQIRQGVDQALLERERTLSKQLSAKAASQVQLLSGPHTPEQVAALEKEIDALEKGYQQAQTEIRRTSPHYAALTQPQPLTLKEIQQQILDQNTLLLEYSLGDEHSYVWAITNDSITSRELAKREEIEKTARQVYQLMTARSSSPKGETAEQKRARIAQAEAQLPEVAGQLTRMVLDPVATQLGNKRLVIVADGALQYVPFGMLPSPETASHHGVSATITGRNRAESLAQPLIVKHDVVTLPSASTIAVLRRELDRRKPAPNLLAVIADPVFSASDDRLKTVVSNGSPQAEPATASLTASPDSTRIIEHLAAGSAAGHVAMLKIPRLPFTRREADQIMLVAPSSTNLKAIDFKANRATVTSGALGQYRYVHFATHGYLDTERPDLSALVFSMVDEQGKPQDGFLRANEIYNLHLPAELVVLSACQTGLGKEVKGEGLIGLTRGFMYAGAARVVVSLWNVNDKATSELMTKFYQKMLKQGERPAAALRAAQVEMWKQKQWQSPYYWAAFTMQGEWR
jgi:CHAT domain-containing protein/predicted negative regulator of RcsB-dependent stress response